jgi:galactokinase
MACGMIMQITCAEIDFLADFANDHPGVLGARMMGGGFGGCTINLVERTAMDDFVTSILPAYHQKFAIEAQVIPFEIGPGTHEIGSPFT